MNKTLFCLNNTNDLSWWNIVLDNLLVTITWGSNKTGQVTDTMNRIIIDLPTPEKAQDEYFSRIRFQKDRKGYTEDKPSVPPTFPMLAQEYKKDVVMDSFAIQPKLDGIRCIVSSEGMTSRKNLPITSCPHIELYLPWIPEGIKLDGELYIPNTDFSTIMSLVMRDRAVIHNPVFKEIEFRVFDMLDMDIPFSERIVKAEETVNLLQEKYLEFRTSTNHPFQSMQVFSHKCPFKMVETTMFNTPLTKEIADEYLAMYSEQNYEGIMIRNLDSHYRMNYRSPHLRKYKGTFKDNEFEVIDVVEGHGKTAVFVLQATESHLTFRSSIRATRARKQQIWNYRENYIGRIVKVEHEGLSSDGIPRCPVIIHIYDKEVTDK